MANSHTLGTCYSRRVQETLNTWRPQALDKRRRCKASIGYKPLVAIGGFTPERAIGAFEHGADSVCVVTDVQRHTDPVARIKKWLEVTLLFSAAG